MSKDKKINKILRAIQHLETKYDLRYNVVSSVIEFKFKESQVFSPLSDRDLDNVYVDATLNDSDVSISDIRSILNSKLASDYNPFIEYIDGLPPWDGVDYIEQLAITIETHDNDFFKWALKKWLVAVVACMLKEDVTNHQCIILAGNQGIGKSTWINNLVPAPLKSYYYTGDINLHNKDTLYYLSNTFLINLDELASMSYKSVTRLKEIVTKGHISFRAPYARFNSNYVRRASFIGSVNGNEFLYDLTGNRRFISIEAFKFSNHGRHQLNLDLIYSQAYFLLLNKFKYWFDEEDEKKLELNNQRFLVLSTEEETLLQNFKATPYEEGERPQYISPYPDYLSASEIFIKLFAKKNTTLGEATKLGKILTKHGFEKKIVKGGIRKYKVYPLTNKLPSV